MIVERVPCLRGTCAQSLLDPAYDMDKFFHMIAKNTTMVSDETTTGQEILKPQTENATEDLTKEELILVYVVIQPKHDFRVFPVSYLIRFDEVVQKFKKIQWHL